MTVSTRSSRRRPIAPALPRPSLTGSVVRPDDQLRIRYELYNADVRSGRIVALEPEESIYYVVDFGSQHTAEDPIGSDQVPPDGARGHRRAGTSRVAFEIPSGIEFSTDRLLDLARHPILTNRLADDVILPRVGSDAPTTAIEVPVSLVLSPPGDGRRAGRFRTSPSPLSSGDVTELWSARLTTAAEVAHTGNPRPVVRAIGRRPYDATFPGYLGDLDVVVAQTTTGDRIPLTVHRLSLSSQGATIDVAGDWPSSSELIAYQHRVRLGRDVRVVDVVPGFLAPFGHAATLTTITERRLLDDASPVDDGDLTASLVTETFLAITGGSVEFDAEFTNLIPHGGRRLPFTAIEAVDAGTGPVSRGTIRVDGWAISRRNAARLIRDGRPLQVTYRATDRAGADAVTFDLAAVFVAADEAVIVGDRVGNRRTTMARLASWYRDGAPDSYRLVRLDGQTVAWADPSVGAAGSNQTTNWMRISLDRPDTAVVVDDAFSAIGRPAFHAGVDDAAIVDTASAGVTGGGAAEIEVVVAPRWLRYGVGPENADLGYLDLAAPASPAAIGPSTGNADGLLGCAFSVNTFGQLLGGSFLPDLGELPEFTWRPSEALAGIPRLLGAIDLGEILPEIDLGQVLADLTSGVIDEPEGLPNLRIEPQYEHPDIPEIPTGACLHLSWLPSLPSVPAAKPAFVVVEDGRWVVADHADEPPISAASVFGPGDTRTLLAMTACVPQGSTDFEVSLERCAIQMPPGRSAVVVVALRRIRFHQGSTGSATIEVDIADWSFVNGLSWLEPLKDFVADLLSGGTPSVGGGVSVDADLKLPGISLGVVGVTGIRLGMALDLPDTGTSSIGLDVSSRDDPFRVTILGFGGDGSFGLLVDAQQIVLIEGSLAVSYSLGIDVFLISASVSVSLGVYVVYAVDPDPEVILGAYATVAGSISALGLFEVSGSVTVALEYRVNAKTLRGVATVTGEVSSPFGKKEVTHDVEVEVDFGDSSGGAARRLGSASLMRMAALAGSAMAAGVDPGDGDLTFADRVSEDDWNDYCDAFVAA